MYPLNKRLCWFCGIGTETKDWLISEEREVDLHLHCLKKEMKKSNDPDIEIFKREFKEMLNK